MPYKQSLSRSLNSGVKHYVDIPKEHRNTVIINLSRRCPIISNPHLLPVRNIFIIHEGNIVTAVRREALMD